MLRERGVGLALALLLLDLCAAAARADAPWQPLLTQDGVTVEERTSPERVLPELRATVEVDAAIFEVLAVIADVPRQKEWMYDCEESRLIRADGPDVVLLYNLTAAPWPASDRDVVLRSESTLLTPAQHVTVRFANTTDSGTPPIDGVVRMPRLVGGYDLVSIAPDRTRVTYLLDVDPGGSLPAFIVTRTSRNMPLHTLLGLRRQVASTRGTYEAFVSSWSERR